MSSLSCRKIDYDCVIDIPNLVYQNNQDDVSASNFSTIEIETPESIECPILLVDTKDIAITNCGHMFDRESLQKELRIRSFCPVCRAEMKEITIKNENKKVSLDDFIKEEGISSEITHNIDQNERTRDLTEVGLRILRSRENRNTKKIEWSKWNISVLTALDVMFGAAGGFLFYAMFNGNGAYVALGSFSGVALGSLLFYLGYKC